MGASTGKLLQNVIMPIAALVALAMGMVVAFIWFSASTQDRVALDQSVTAVSDAIQRKLAKLGLAALDFGWWNEAVLNLDVALNQQWADENVGLYIYEVHGYALSVVLDRDNRIIYQQLDGEHASTDPFALLGPDLATLVGAARAAPLKEPAPATGILPFGDHLALVAASTVTPQNPGDIEIPDGPRVVLIYAKRLDEALLEDIAQPLPISDLRLVGDDVTPTSDAVLPLTSPDGVALGQLIWVPHQPGRAFLHMVAPALGIAILVIGAFTYAVLRHARETTNAVEASEARFKDVADASSAFLGNHTVQAALLNARNPALLQPDRSCGVQLNLLKPRSRL
jgi:sensor domain CHASE-containing protein